ncbi:MAG: hypothetical protein OXI96_08805 [Acidimicrobiaceae bacterium]|nr:hypothetical protein [Acidimicrobiaceae bacterium]
MVATRKGVDVELTVLAELTGGAYELATMNTRDLMAAAEVVKRYRGGDYSLTLTIVVLGVVFYGVHSSPGKSDGSGVSLL